MLNQEKVKIFQQIYMVFFFSSLRARDRLLVSYDNVKLQRETFEIRMSGATFSTAALFDAALKEIYFYEQLIENEKKLLMADLNSRHLEDNFLIVSS